MVPCQFQLKIAAVRFFRHCTFVSGTHSNQILFFLKALYTCSYFSIVPVLSNFRKWSGYINQSYKDREPLQNEMCLTYRYLNQSTMFIRINFCELVQYVFLSYIMLLPLIGFAILCLTSITPSLIFPSELRQSFHAELMFDWVTVYSTPPMLLNSVATVTRTDICHHESIELRFFVMSVWSGISYLNLCILIDIAAIVTCYQLFFRTYTCWFYSVCAVC